MDAISVQNHRVRGTQKRTYFTKRTTLSSLLPSPSWPTAASPRRRRRTHWEHSVDIWQPAPRALPYTALLHYTEIVWREGGRLTNWWITAPGAYTYNTRAWTRACVCRLGQLVRSFYMSPETRPFFFRRLVVVVKSSPSIQTHSHHFWPPTHKPLRLQRLQYYAILLLCPYTLLLSCCSWPPPSPRAKNVRKRVWSFVIRPFCSLPAKVTCLLFLYVHYYIHL